ncbi:hypothetical protein V8C86DRAFT_2629960 [Haematococcus lacustris]
MLCGCWVNGWLASGYGVFVASIYIIAPGGERCCRPCWLLMAAPGCYCQLGGAVLILARCLCLIRSSFARTSCSLHATDLFCNLKAYRAIDGMLASLLELGCTV